MNDQAIATSIREVAALFEPDGYRVEDTRAGDRIELHIVATSSACPECLVPKNVMETIIRGVFTEHGSPLEPGALTLRYPDE